MLVLQDDERNLQGSVSPWMSKLRNWYFILTSMPMIITLIVRTCNTMLLVCSLEMTLSKASVFQTYRLEMINSWIVMIVTWMSSMKKYPVMKFGFLEYVQLQSSTVVMFKSIALSNIIIHLTALKIFGLSSINPRREYSTSDWQVIILVQPTVTKTLLTQRMVRLK